VRRLFFGRSAIVFLEQTFLCADGRVFGNGSVSNGERLNSPENGSTVAAVLRRSQPGGQR